MNVRDIPRLIPIWFLPLAILVGYLLINCSGCRGGASLGKGSAGTVIKPKTPQEINKENAPELKALPPVPTIITPHKNNQPVRSAPTPPESKSAEANPIIINPKPAEKLKSFSPTINRNAPPVKLTSPISPAKEKTKESSTTTSNTSIVITSPSKNSQTDNKATSPVIVASNELDTPAKTFNWIELSFNYLLFIILAIFIWTVYDIFKIRKSAPEKIRKQNGVKKATRTKPLKKKPAKKKPAKKKSSKKN